MTPQPAPILGVHDGTHDASAALLLDGELVAACSEERFCRRKGAGGWPVRSIQACLDRAGLEARDVHAVAVSGYTTPNPGLRLLRPLQGAWHLESGRFYTEEKGIRQRFDAWLQFDSPFPRMGSHGTAARALRPLLLRALARQSGLSPPGGFQLFDHHRCHAATAWMTSGWEDALVITADGLGDGVCLAVYRGQRGGLQRLAAKPFPHSYGLLYATITGLLGFKPFRHEGKLMGLASSGDAGAVELPFPFGGPPEDRRFTRRLGVLHQGWLDPLRHQRREDVCAWLQRGVEQDICDLATHWLDLTSLDRLALAGGLFGNVCLNAALAALPQVKALQVFPNMGDGGLSVGAALLHQRALGGSAHGRLEHVFLGPEHSEAEVRQAADRLAQQGHQVSRPHDLVAPVTQALLEGRLVGCCHGPMEFGPRALGHRSILAPATSQATERLNRCLARSDFMPFAPMLLADDASRWLQDLPTVRHAAGFMTVNLQAHRELRRRCPAAVHSDGSVRPLLVDAERHPLMHGLLSSYRRATAQRGLELPALINTSFNLHEEPIVLGPESAATSYHAAGLDLLVLQDRLIRRLPPGST